ncbi:MAG: hypothetical protein KBT18_13185 [Comamonas sp.]|nr:hypothetical protein [Candidatus Comamonas equi]
MQQLLVKTASGQQAFKERSPLLAGKLRSAFLMFDGQRTVFDVLQATQGLGVTLADIEGLLQAQLLQEVQPQASAPAATPTTDAMDSGRAPQERYRDAYPLAVALTGKLGLSGFRLNLSVESCSSYQELAALAPKIKDAVQAKDYAKLEQALFA